MTLMLRQMTQTISGRVRVAAIHGVGLHELPPYIKRFSNYSGRVVGGLLVYGLVVIDWRDNFI